MQTMRQAWTDERLDDLNCKVDEMSREMHAEFRAVRGEMNSRFDSLQSQMSAMTRAMLMTTIGCFATLLGTLLATQL